MNDINLKPDISNQDALSFLKKGERCRNCDKREGALCEVLTCEELDQLDGIMSWVKFPAGQTIFTEGDNLDNYYNITEGVIRLIRIMPDGRRAVLDFLYPGDFVGLNANGEHAYSAEAVTPVRLCCFPKQKLQALFGEIPKMESRLLGIFADKLVSSQHQQADLARKSPRERLAAFLLGLSGKRGLNAGENVFRLPMSREDISDYLGLTIETISRTLSAFAKESLIKIDQRKTITLLAPEKLQDLADGA